MKSKIANRTLESARAMVGLLVIIAVLAMLLVPLARAVELTPPSPVQLSVGSGFSGALPIGYKSEGFLADGFCFAITNSGASVLVTNDWGCTNLTIYKHLPPNSMLFTTNTYVTNGLISPFWYMRDGTNAIFQQLTGVPAWGDVPFWCDMNGTVSTNVSLSVGFTGATSTTTNTDTVYVWKTSYGRYYDTNTPWSFTIGPVNGTNLWYTNATAPVGFLAGAAGFRVMIVSGTNAAATTNFFSELRMNGFVGVGVGR